MWITTNVTLASFLVFFFNVLVHFWISISFALLKYSKFKNLSQLAFTCWKATKETLEKGVKYVQS